MNMHNTYTYTARSVENPERMVTFTLHDERMSVGAGAALEQVEQALAAVGAGQDDAEAEHPPQLWLKPLAVSLVERGTRPFHIRDIDVDVDGADLTVRGWVRTGGLRFAPLTLMSGRVDNADAAQAFATEIAARQEALAVSSGIFVLLEYWGTWILGSLFLLGLFQFWRRRALETDAET